MEMKAALLMEGSCAIAPNQSRPAEVNGNRRKGRKMWGDVEEQVNAGSPGSGGASPYPSHRGKALAFEDVFG
jgi:hypothetical protein